MAVPAKPLFFVDADGLPALVFETPSGKRYRTTLDACDGGCAVFALGPRYDGCTLQVCTGAAVTACPPDSTVRFKVCYDCTRTWGAPC